MPVVLAGNSAWKQPLSWFRSINFLFNYVKLCIGDLKMVLSFDEMTVRDDMSDEKQTKTGFRGGKSKVFRIWNSENAYCRAFLWNQQRSWQMNNINSITKFSRAQFARFFSICKSFFFWGLSSKNRKIPKLHPFTPYSIICRYCPDFCDHFCNKNLVGDTFFLGAYRGGSCILRWFYFGKISQRLLRGTWGEPNFNQF